MGIGDAASPPKVPQEQVPSGFEGWAAAQAAYQAYYSQGQPPFPQAPHPYMGWPGQPMMPPYGAPPNAPPFAMYPGMYGHPAYPPFATPPAAIPHSEAIRVKAEPGAIGADLGLGGSARTQREATSSLAGGPSNGGKGQEASNGDSSVSGSASSGSPKGDRQKRGSNMQLVRKQSYEQIGPRTEGPMPERTLSTTVQGGKGGAGPPGTSLGMSLDYWQGGSPAPPRAPASASKPPPKKLQSGGGSAAGSDLWLQVGKGSGSGGEGEIVGDERELKRQKRKQSNRESARRSRLRKQAECEELGGKVDALTAENQGLRAELARLSEQCSELALENKSLQEQLHMRRVQSTDRLYAEGERRVADINLNGDQREQDLQNGSGPSQPQVVHRPRAMRGEESPRLGTVLGSGQQQSAAAPHDASKGGGHLGKAAHETVVAR